jgi:hypothetical protein
VVGPEDIPYQTVALAQIEPTFIVGHDPRGILAAVLEDR